MNARRVVVDNSLTTGCVGNYFCIMKRKLVVIRNALNTTGPTGDSGIFLLIRRRECDRMVVRLGSSLYLCEGRI